MACLPCLHVDLEEGLDGPGKSAASEQEAPRPRRWNQLLVVLVACCVIAGVLLFSVISTAVNATLHGAWWRVAAKLCVSGWPCCCCRAPLLCLNICCWATA